MKNKIFMKIDSLTEIAIILDSFTTFIGTSLTRQAKIAPKNNKKPEKPTISPKRTSFPGPVLQIQ